jgi:hypothetical protein
MVSGLFGYGKKYYIENVWEGLSGYRYLRMLTHTGGFGCQVFGVKKADWFFFGDSHNYAGWDMSLMAKELGTKSLSSCFLGGFYLETWDILKKKMEESDYTPKVIVYGLSSRAFLDIGSKKKSIEQHIKVINSGQIKGMTSIDYFKRISRFWRWDDFKRRQKAQALQWERQRFGKLKYISNKLNNIPLEKYHDYIEKNKNLSYNNWKKLLREWNYTKDLSQKLKNFCSYISKKRIKLVLVHIPESPKLRSLYSAQMNESYKETLSELKKCTHTYVDSKPFESKLDNRFYFNRLFMPKYPYGTVMGTPGPEDHLFEESIYDMDHLNWYGAHVFTKWFAAKIKRTSLVYE